MGGIYIHIPFCRQACRYCDFFFTVSTKYQDEFTDTLLVELRERSGELKEMQSGSLYLGGGTPSVLSKRNMERILDTVYRYYRLDEDAERTIECNPDDLDRSSLVFLLEAGFNRISIGIQSFRDEDLALMRRSHGASQAISSVEDAAGAGFENINADLIYGIPGQTAESWERNLDQLLSMPVQHLSAYHLTFEPGTVFDHWRKNGRLMPVHEEESISMYRILRRRMVEAGFDHYEISNFAASGMRSAHNIRYWSGEPYLGFGPSAHSFDGENRSWNISSLKGYLAKGARGESVSESEILSDKEKYHDHLITSLRTSRGIDPQYLAEQFGEEIYAHFNRSVDSYLENGFLLFSAGRIIIDPDRWMLADHVVRDLFMQ